MVNVYAWPPVAAVGSEWSVQAPIEVSRSLLSGRRYASSFQPERRVASLQVSSLGRGSLGAGYCEILKKRLQGGEHLVRLYSHPINLYRDALREAETRQTELVNWTDVGDPLNWTDGGDPTLWYSGRLLQGTVTTDGSWPAISVTGLLPNVLAARPAEFLTVYQGPGETNPDTVQVAAAAYSDASGAALIRTMTAPAHDGRVCIGVSDTGVFEVVGELPRAVQGVRGDWTYAWSFQEVFADEVPGGFVEVDPWT